MTPDTEQGQILGGVCAQLAALSGIHTNLVRIAFVLLALASGIGIVGYLVLWLVFANSNDGEKLSPQDRLRIVLNDSQKSVEQLKLWVQVMWSDRDTRAWPRPLGRFWFGTTLVLVGVTIFLRSVGLFSWLGLWEFVGLVSVLAGIGILTSNQEQPE